MTQVSPWSVKGVAAEAREAAKTSARKAGVTIGAWLSQVIHASAANGRAAPGAGAADSSGRAAGSALVPDSLGKDLKRLQDRYAGLEERLTDTIEPLVRKMRRLDTRVEEIQEFSEKMRGLKNLPQRIGELEEHSARPANLNPIEDKIHALEAQMEGLGGGEFPDSGEVRNLSTMVEEIRAASQHQLSELQTELQEVKAQSSVMATTGPMERAMTRLAERVQKLEDSSSDKKGGLFG